MNYYNEFDPFAAQWLRNLIAEGLIPDGDVDERSITEVDPLELVGYDQHHFFAGIGGWSLALRLAGWPDDREIWTGSCPCQPFSVAGKGGGADDPRHLWPDFFRLIRSCRPAVVMGEQVAGAAGYGWLDGVRADLAGEGYASRGVDIPACAVDAPHIRQRLYWIAAAGVGLADTGREPGWPGPGDAEDRAVGADIHVAGAMGDACGQGLALGSVPGLQRGDVWQEGPTSGPAGAGSFWSRHAWIECHDGKARRIPEPGFPLLASGVSNRVGQWRGFGNAIVPPLAAEVIAAWMEVSRA